MDNNMNFTMEEIEDLKEKLWDICYVGRDEKDLKIFYKDARREYIDSIEDLSELIEMFESNGLLDSEDDNDA